MDTFPASMDISGLFDLLERFGRRSCSCRWGRREDGCNLCRSESCAPKPGYIPEGHPPSFWIRETRLLRIVDTFFAEPIFGTHRRELLAATLPSVLLAGTGPGRRIRRSTMVAPVVSPARATLSLGRQDDLSARDLRLRRCAVISGGFTGLVRLPPVAGWPPQRTLVPM